MTTLNQERSSQTHRSGLYGQYIRELKKRGGQSYSIQQFLDDFHGGGGHLGDTVRSFFTLDRSQGATARPKPYASLLRAAINNAMTAAAYRAHTPKGMTEPTAYFKQSLADWKILDLRTEPLPPIADRLFADGDSATTGITPRATLSGQRLTVEAAVMLSSRIHDAGAHLIVRDENAQAMPVGKTGDIVLMSAPAHFSTIEPAKFALQSSTEVGGVLVENDVITSDIPVARAEIDWGTVENYEFRVSLSRGKIRTYETVVDEVMLAIIKGIARAADVALLNKIAASDPASFSLAAVAAAGLKFGELRGIIGTSAAGAFTVDDKLRASITTGAGAVSGGVPAELTDAIAGTIVGAWDRAGVAVHPNIELLAERLDRAGNVDVTARVGLIPLLPDPSMFWKVA